MNISLRTQSHCTAAKGGRSKVCQGQLTYRLITDNRREQTDKRVFVSQMQNKQKKDRNEVQQAAKNATSSVQSGLCEYVAPILDHQ